MTLLALGARGPEVAQLHQQLLERGLLPPAASEEVAAQAFGPVTAGAVATFQAKSGLEVDGMCGQRTWDALAVGTDTEEPPPPPDPTGAGDFGRAALVQARRLVELRVTEDPLGTNRGPMVDRILGGLDGAGAGLVHYQRDDRAPEGWAGAPWCGRGARYCVDLGALQTLGRPSPLKKWGDLASAVKWRDQARLRRCLAESPAPGRVGLIIIPARDGHEAHGHVVLVAGPVGSDGRFPSYEGNSGNRCAARRRKPEECTGGFVELG